MNQLLLPVVAAQAIWVRLRTERLPPAAGSTNGIVQTSAGMPMRIGILGDSTAAGCGADNHDEGFAGGLARELAARTGRPVEWAVVGQIGATSSRIRHRLLPQLGGRLDVAVLLAGVNDVLDRRDAAEWRDDLAAIVSELAERADHIVVTGIPPFEDFPSLPTALSCFLAQRANILDEVAQQLCAEHPQAMWISSQQFRPFVPEYFARDGFHPSASGYRRWSQLVADQLAF